MTHDREAWFSFGKRNGVPSHCKWSSCKNDWEGLWRPQHIVGIATDGDPLCCTDAWIRPQVLEKAGRITYRRHSHNEKIRFLVWAKAHFWPRYGRAWLENLRKNYIELFMLSPFWNIRLLKRTRREERRYFLEGPLSLSFGISLVSK